MSPGSVPPPTFDRRSSGAQYCRSSSPDLRALPNACEILQVQLKRVSIFCQPSTLAARFQNKLATLFELLHWYHEVIDSIAGRFANVDVLKKLCDTLVICSGAPDANKCHGSDIADFAFRIFEHFTNRDVVYLVVQDEKSEFQLGIHTGSTVGGRWEPWRGFVDGIEVIGDPPKFMVMSGKQ
ncbi:hypothetical protein BJ742DRAFT_800005 [Cladochytrium replicatum]|nr:hypothetical protein BJ742DRAFT_800005 [Cladochytrium replicatum]